MDNKRKTVDECEGFAKYMCNCTKYCGDYMDSEPAKFDVDSVISGFPRPGEYPTKKDLEYFGMVKKKKKERYSIFYCPSDETYFRLVQKDVVMTSPFLALKDNHLFVKHK